MINDAPDGLRPGGWKTIQLGEVLTGAQVNRVLEILQEEKYPKRIKALRDFSHSIEEQLSKKELLPEFFAYWLEFAHIKGDI